jgi:hypothetical protein
MATAALTWLDLTATDRDKVRRVLDLFKEQGTVDELGLGSLRDVFSNVLFPGTSVLHTRLRYVLFIPWIYQEIESWGGGWDVADSSRKLEVRLIDALAESDDPAGVIGIDAREKLARMASSAYWALLVRWGIFVPGRNQGWYQTHLDGLVQRQRDLPRADDPGVVWEKAFTWHPHLPPVPAGFPDEASFALTAQEADFVLGRIQERCPGSLLLWLAQEGHSELAEVLWDEPLALEAPEAMAETVELARRFSLHVEGAPLLYNLLLAELRHELDGGARDQEGIEDYRAALADWAAREGEEQVFDSDVLWRFVALSGGRVRYRQQQFVNAWSQFLADEGPHAVADSQVLRDLIHRREIQLKGNRARVINQGRLLDWSGQTGVGRMVFRWPNVRQLLIDLHQGLGR